MVIGSGPAGEKGAVQAAWYGKRVAIVEKNRPGGACVHSGTLPSKSLRESALHLSGFRTRAIQGLLNLPRGRIPVSCFLAHKDHVIEKAAADVQSNLDRHDIESVQGRGVLVDAHTVRVGERLLDTEFILVATGSRPHRPAHIPFDGQHVYDSDNILELDVLPESLLVIGAGVIGCEYATMFAALGVKVTLLEARERLLAFIDEDVVATLIGGLRELDIDLRLGACVEAMRIRDGGVEATLADGTAVCTDRVLVAAGRSGNTDALGLEAIGVQPGRRGRLEVDEHYRTACHSVLAAGDVLGFPALASASMDQGRLAVCHAFGFDYRNANLARTIPMGIYTIPELSMVGETEQALRARGEDVEVGIALFSSSARGRINGATSGLVKLVFRPSDKKLLGVHIVGENAAELVHIGATALQLSATIDVFIDAVFNHPTLSEAYKYAAYDGLGRLSQREGP